MARLGADDFIARVRLSDSSHCLGAANGNFTVSTGGAQNKKFDSRLFAELKPGFDVCRGRVVMNRQPAMT